MPKITKDFPVRIRVQNTNSELDEKDFTIRTLQPSILMGNQNNENDTIHAFTYPDLQLIDNTPVENVPSVATQWAASSVETGIVLYGTRTEQYAQNLGDMSFVEKFPVNQRKDVILHKDMLYSIDGNTLCKTKVVANVSAKEMVLNSVSLSSVTTTGTLPGQRAGHGHIWDGRQYLYVFGGSSNGSAISNESWRFDSRAGNWTQLANTPSTTVHSSYAVFGTKVYKFGGFDGAATTSTLEVYDTQNNTWSTLSPSGTPPAGRFMAGITVYNRKVYVAGGFNVSGTGLGDFFVYDIDANSWTQLAGVGVSTGEYALIPYKSYLFALGGGRGGSSVYRRYDIDANSWSAVTSAPTNLSTAIPSFAGTDNIVTLLLGGSSAVTYNLDTDTWTSISFSAGNFFLGACSWSGRVEAKYVFSGVTTYWSSVRSNGVFRFNLAYAQSNVPGTLTVSEITTGGSLPGARRQHNMGLIDNKIYIHGGENGTSGLSDTWEYDIDSNSWLQRAAGTTSWASGCVAHNGLLYTALGWDGSSLLNSLRSYNPSTNTWNSLANAPYSVLGPSAVANGDAVYVFGGNEHPSGTSYARLYQYSISNNTWSLLSDGSTSGVETRCFAQMAYWNNKLFVVGGFDTNSATAVRSSLWMYDLQTNTWSRKTNSPSPEGYALSFVDGDRWYILGGRDTSFVSSDAYVYDFRFNSWSGPIALGTSFANIHNAACVTEDKEILFFGGTNASSVNLSNNVRTIGRANYGLYFEPALTSQLHRGHTIEAVTTPSSPRPGQRHVSSHGVINGKLYIAEGINGSTRYNDCWAFDPADNTWTQRANSSHTTNSPGFVVADNRLWLLGGYQHSPAIETNAFRVYDPVANTWTARATGPSARQIGGQMAVGYDGHIYTFGGWNGSNNVNDFWRYNIATNTWTQITASAPCPGKSAPSMVSHEQSIYIFEGTNEDGNPNASTWSYHIPTGTWTQRATKPVTVARGLSYVRDGKYYSIGGRASSGSTDYTTNSLYYDFEKDSWSFINSSLAFFAGISFFDNTTSMIYYWGGMAGSSYRDTDMRRLNPQTVTVGSNYRLLSTITTSNNATLALSPDKNVVVAGGDNGAMAFNAIDLTFVTSMSSSTPVVYPTMRSDDVTLEAGSFSHPCTNPADTLIARAYSDRIEVRNTSGNTLVQNIPITLTVNGMKFSYNGEHLIVSFDNAVEPLRMYNTVDWTVASSGQVPTNTFRPTKNFVHLPY